MSLYPSHRNSSQLNIDEPRTALPASERYDARSVPASFGKALDRIFAGYNGTPFGIRFWNGAEWQSSIDAPVFHVVLKVQRAWDALVSSTTGWKRTSACSHQLRVSCLIFEL